MDFFSIVQPLDRLHDWFIAAGFALARMTGVIIVMPVFTRIGLTGILRGAVALALSLPLIPMIVSALASERLTVLATGVILAKEVVIGLMIGLVLGAPFWAAEAAGDILDLQRGSTSSTLIDPLSITEENITGTLFGLIMVAIYFGSGGLPLTLRTVYDSYGLWPVSSVLPNFDLAASQYFIALLDSVVTMGLVLVSPIVIFMLLTDLLLALVSRAAPHLNVFALSLSVKNLVFALLLVLYCAFLFKYMGNDLSSLLHAGSDLENLAKPPSR